MTNAEAAFVLFSAQTSRDADLIDRFADLGYSRTSVSQLARILCLALALVVAAHATSLAACKKKGLGFVPVPGLSPVQVMQAIKPSWYYTWTMHPLPSVSDIPFVPMFSGRKTTLGNDLELLNASPRFPILLDFNEPDLPGETQMSSASALTYWPVLRKHAERLSSPAPSVYDRNWLRTFMSGATSRAHGVDFMAMHYYGPPDVARFLKSVDELYDSYRLPIWVTEFAVFNADWRAQPRRYSPDQAYEFLKQAAPELEHRPYVQRFAWWGIGGAHPEALSQSQFFRQDGSLTEVGRYYASLESEDVGPLCGTPTAHDGSLP